MTRFFRINYTRATLFLNFLSTMAAIAPSPVTLHAVPKLSIAMYRAIIIPFCASLKPSTPLSNPSDAIIAPPGIPGAAIMVTPSIAMNSPNDTRLYSPPCMTISANAHATIFSVDPDICIVAHSGTVKPAISSFTPIFIVCRSVTGIVAADDCVPSAVKYAGIMVHSILSGFFLNSKLAMPN